jgi:hypothetical protein
MTAMSAAGGDPKEKSPLFITAGLRATPTQTKN